MLHRLMGLEMKLRQYEVGEAFVDAVTNDAGFRALDAAWQGPTGEAARRAPPRTHSLTTEGWRGPGRDGVRSRLGGLPGPGGDGQGTGCSGLPAEGSPELSCRSPPLALLAARSMINEAH